MCGAKEACRGLDVECRALDASEASVRIITYIHRWPSGVRRRDGNKQRKKIKAAQDIHLTGGEKERR